MKAIVRRQLFEVELNVGLELCLKYCKTSPSQCLSPVGVNPKSKSQEIGAIV